MARQFLILIAVLATLAVPAGAQTCAGPETIVTLADRILATRPGLPRLHQRNFGTEAAYLKLHYGGLTPQQGLALLVALDGAMVRQAADAAAALAITLEGPEAGLKLLDPDPVRALIGAGDATVRALLLADRGASYYPLLARAEAAPGMEPALLAPLLRGSTVAVLLSDQPDAVRAEIAGRAEAAGRLEAAAVLWADVADAAAYADFLARHPEAADPLAELRAAWLGSGLRQLPKAPLDRIMYGARREGVSSWLTTAANQSGWIDEIAAVSAEFAGAVEAGLVDPVADPEAGWLLQLRALIALRGEAEVASMLSFFDWPPPKLRHYAGTAAESLDVMALRDALAMVAAGTAGVPATPPPQLAGGQDWAEWVAVAQALGGGGVPELGTPGRILAAIELMDATGRTAEAADLAEQAMEPQAAMAVWRDLILRSDRRCDAWTAHPGAALWLGGEVLWRY